MKYGVSDNKIIEIGRCNTLYIRGRVRRHVAKGPLYAYYGHIFFLTLRRQNGLEWTFDEWNSNIPLLSAPGWKNIASFALYGFMSFDTWCFLNAPNTFWDIGHDVKLSKSISYFFPWDL